MADHSNILSGKSHRQRSLAGCSPWGRTELGMTKGLTLHFTQNPVVKQGRRHPLLPREVKVNKSGEWTLELSN